MNQPNKLSEIMNQYSIYKTIIPALKYYLSGKGKLKTDVKLPEKLGKYTLMEKISKDTTISNAACGIYRDNNGKEVFIKYCVCNEGGYQSITFKNEIMNYKTLNELTKKIKDIPKPIQNVRFPLLLDYKIEDNYSYLVLEYVKGKALNKLQLSKKFSTLKKVNDYLEFISRNSNPEHHLSKRSNLTLLLIYPFLYLKAVLSHTSAFQELTKGFLRVVGDLSGLLMRQDLSIVHRDLHGENILITKDNTIYIIDPQFSVMADPLLEDAYTLRLYWHDREMRKSLLKNFNAKEVFLFSIVAATHDLIDHNMTKNEFNLTKSYLKYSLSI